MELADTDGSGTIDLSEFKDFINKLSEKMEESKVEEIFKEIDENGDGEISKEEFGKALLSALKEMKVEEEDNWWIPSYD